MDQEGRILKGRNPWQQEKQKPTPGFNGKIFELWVLNRLVLNFCICSAPLQDLVEENNQGWVVHQHSACPRSLRLEAHSVQTPAPAACYSTMKSKFPHCHHHSGLPGRKFHSAGHPSPVFPRLSPLCPFPSASFLAPNRQSWFNCFLLYCT